MFAVLLSVSLIGSNIALYALTSLISVFFLVLIVVLKPYLFLAVFFAVSYPVSLTIGKLEIDNLGILFLLALSLLSILFIIQRKNFAVDKRKIAFFSSFYVLVALILAGCISGFLHSGNDSLEILVKFFVFGVIPASFLIVMPLNKENLVPVLELAYYLNFIIFLGFSIAYWFFKILNPAAFEDFFNAFDNPIGTSLFMMEFSTVSLIFITFKAVSQKTKIFVYITIALAFIYVLITFQRSFVVAIFVALSYLIVFKYKISMKMILIVASTILVLTLLILNVNMSLIFGERQMYKLERTMAFVEQLSKNKDILRTKENTNTGTIGIRIITIMASWDKTRQHIYLGNGIGTFSNVSEFKYPHNIIYEFLYSTGLIGLLIFVSVAGKIFIQSNLKIKKIKDPKLKNALLFVMALVLLSFVTLQFSGGIMNIFPNTFFLMFIVVLTLKCLNRFNVKSKEV